MPTACLSDLPGGIICQIWHIMPLSLGAFITCALQSIRIRSIGTSLVKGGHAYADYKGGTPEARARRNRQASDGETGICGEPYRVVALRLQRLEAIPNLKYEV
jgi:hypothetical protein